MARGTRLFSCAVLTAALLAATAQAHGSRVRGVVTNARGKPVQGVRVLVRAMDQLHEYEGKTDKKGRWATPELPQGQWQILFQLEGYTDQTLRWTSGEAEATDKLRVVLRRPGESGGAFEDVEAAASSAPASRRAPAAGPTIQEAERLSAEGRYGEAIERYQRLLAAEPELETLHQGIGNVYMKLQQYDMALQHYQLVYKKNPSSTAALSNLAEVYLKKKDIDNALVYLDRLIEKEPGHPTANFNLAEILLSADEPEEAIRHYEAALASRPQWAEAYLRLGYASLSVGRSAQAMAAFQKYLALEPESADAGFVRETLELLK